jgi:hypothetical protein
MIYAGTYNLQEGSKALAKLFGVVVETTPHETENTPPPPFTTVPFIGLFAAELVNNNGLVLPVLE